VLAAEPVAAGAVGGELHGLPRQLQPGVGVARRLLDQGGVDQRGHELLEVVDRPGLRQDLDGERAGAGQVPRQASTMVTYRWQPTAR
jgi:hypothetical protein